MSFEPMIIPMEVVTDEMIVPMEVETQYELPIELETLEVDHNGVYNSSSKKAWNKAIINISAPTGRKKIINNGIHDVYDYAEADVDVPNSYAASDEGKVVQNGELVGQTELIVTENGEYDTTLNDIVIVNTPEVQPVYVSSTGLLYTPIMVMDLSNADKSAPGTGLSILAMLDRYGAMPYLEDLTITGIIRWVSAAGSIGNEKIFSSNLYPSLKKLTITPTEIRKDRGAVIDPTPDVFKLGHYAFSETNLTHLTIGSLGGLVHQGGDGYLRRDMPCPPGIHSNDIGSLDGLHLTVYAKEYLSGGGFLTNASASLAPNTTYTCLDYLTGEELFP